MHYPARTPLTSAAPLIGAAIILLTAASVVASPAPKRVLIVHSFGNASPPFTVHSIAFQTALVQKMGASVDLDEVSLDMARYADADMQEAIVEYLEKRRVQWQPDLVVPIGSPAGIFVSQYRERLFPDTPILYTSLDRRFLPDHALDKNAAYIGQIFDLPGLIQDMLKIAPATKHVAVVVGTTPLEARWKKMFEKAAEPLAGRIEVTYFDNLSFEQTLERSRKLPPNSFIFFLLLLRDAAGVTYNADEALQRLHAEANAPINSIFDHQMGLGIVGGRLYQGAQMGRESAEIALRILHGEPASSFPPKLIDPLPPRYDWRELHRWKMDEKSLPTGSVVSYREPTLWPQYRDRIIAGFSVLAVETALVVALLANFIKRRRAERSLTESEARFRALADAAPIMMWMSGPDKLSTFLNSAWLEFTGREMEQQLGNGWSEGVHPSDLDECLATYTSAFDARQPFTMQYRLRRNDGEYRWVVDSGVPRYGPRKNFRGYVGTCMDVTDLLEKEQELREIEDRVSLAAEAAQLGVWERDPETNEMWASDKARELLQFGSHDPLTHTDFQNRVHPDDRARRDAATEKAIQNRNSYELEYRVVLPDGRLRWIAGRGRCVIGEDDKCRLLGVSMDVTTRKLAEEQARRSRDQVDFLSRASLLGEMTASLAHELTQPLSAIVTNASAGIQYIEKNQLDPVELKDIFTDVVADGRRAYEIMHNVRSAIKKGTPIRGRINLNDVVKIVAHMVHAEAAAHFCSIETSTALGLPPVEGDPTQMQQVLINLVRNAFDAMRDTPPDRRSVQVATHSNGSGTVCVDVRDHGCGISELARERLFEQFFTTKEEGLGMGLSIVRSIIEAHGGSIAAENAEGGGARFSFELPVSKSA